MSSSLLSSESAASGVLTAVSPPGFLRTTFPARDVPPEQPRTPPAPIPLWSVSASGRYLRLTRPIAIRVTFEEGLYFAENETLSVCGHGATIREALQDAFEQVVYFFDHYRSLSLDDVMGPAVELRRLFRELFEEDDAD